MPVGGMSQEGDFEPGQPIENAEKTGKPLNG